MSKYRYPLKLKVGQEIHFHNNKRVLTLRRVGIKGFNFCNEYDQKVYRKNFYCDDFKHENEVPDNYEENSYVFQIPTYIYSKINHKKLKELS